MSQPAKSRAPALPIVAGPIGNVIEWYDFAVYAYFAPTIGALFFPSDVPNRSLLLSFGVFGVGFFVRPLGGFFFGHYGDRRGRRNALAATVILMGASTGNHLSFTYYLVAAGVVSFLVYLTLAETYRAELR